MEKKPKKTSSTVDGEPEGGGREQGPGLEKQYEGQQGHNPVNLPGVQVPSHS